MSHEKIASRLASILQQLNDGHTINVKDLAEEFNVSERTIQRDLNERFSFLPFDCDKSGNYSLDPAFLGPITGEDLNQFVNSSGIKSLYPDIAKSWIQNVQKTKYQDVYKIISHNYEESNGSEIFRVFEKSIKNNHQVSFRYKEKWKCQHWCSP